MRAVGTCVRAYVVLCPPLNPDVVCTLKAALRGSTRVGAKVVNQSTIRTYLEQQRFVSFLESPHTLQNPKILDLLRQNLSILYEYFVSFHKWKYNTICACSFLDFF